jgi:hypothetical protein
VSISVSVLVGLAIVAALLGTMALALYLFWWVVMVVVSFIPILGRRHRHADWERLNR